MPSLPSAPPVPHALLSSPLVGLGILLGVTIFVSLVCVAVSRVRSKIAERRAHRVDVEAGADSTISVVDTKANDSPRSPSATLLAARRQLQSLERKVNTRKCVAEIHKRLMAERNSQTTKPVITRMVPATQGFMQRHGQKHQYLPGRVGVHRKQREAAGPSSLRVVFYPAAEPVVDTVSEAEAAPVSAPVEDSIPSLENVALTVVTPTKTRSPKRPRALLLAALANGYDSDSDSESEYDISVASEISLAFTFDAIRGVWTTAKITSSASTATALDVVISTPIPISVLESASASAVVSVIEELAAAPTPARPLIDSRLPNLRRAAKAGTTTTSASPKRGSRQIFIEDKENSSAAGQSNLQNMDTARYPIHAIHA